MAKQKKHSKIPTLPVFEGSVSNRQLNTLFIIAQFRRFEAAQNGYADTAQLIIRRRRYKPN